MANHVAPEYSTLTIWKIIQEQNTSKDGVLGNYLLPKTPLPSEKILTHQNS